MPAPSVDALRDFETQFDALLAAILADIAEEHSLDLASHATTEELVPGRLEHEFATTEALATDGANLTRPTTGAQIGFSGTITLRHVYDHTRTNNAAAGALRGALRTLFSPETRAITEANLPWLEVAALTEVSSVRSRYKDEKGKMLSEFLLTLGVVFHIRESAWPGMI